MPQPINIKFISTFDNAGVIEAQDGIKTIEAKYQQLAKNPLTVSAFSNNLKKMFSVNANYDDIKKYSEDFITNLSHSMVIGGKSTQQFDKALKDFTSNVSFMDTKLAKDLLPTLSRLQNEYRPLVQSTEEASSVLGSFGQAIGKQFFAIMGRTLVTAATFGAIHKLTQFVKESSAAAAEAEQKFNKLQTVFAGVGSAADTANKLASKIGVAQSTSANSLSTIGDLLQAQGATVSESLRLASDWAEQLQDIINFKDIPMTLDEFASSFMAGAAGNTRNFRQFGSIVKESTVQVELANRGMENLTGSALEYQKMLIRAELALKQQKNAIGATKREWDTVLSINRRLTETQKEHKELLGEEMNEALSGIRKWWTEILEESNKALKVKKEYFKWTKEGSKGSMQTPYDISTKKDFKTFEKSLKNLLIYFETSGNLDIAKRKKELDIGDVPNIQRTMTLFGASLDDVLKVFPNLNSEIINLLKSYQEQVQAQDKIKSAYEKQQAEFDKLQDGFDSFQESLNAIQGVNVTSSSLISGFTGADFAKFFNDLKETDLQTAIEQLQNATYTSMGKVFENAIGEFGGYDLLEEQKKSLKQLGELAWNEAQTTKDYTYYDIIVSILQEINKQIFNIDNGFENALLGSSLKESDRIKIELDFAKKEAESAWKNAQGNENDEAFQTAKTAYNNLKEQYEAQIELEKSLAKAKEQELKAIEDLSERILGWEEKTKNAVIDSKYSNMPSAFSDYFNVKKEWEQALSGVTNQTEKDAINRYYATITDNLKKIKDNQIVYSDLKDLEDALGKNKEDLDKVAKDYGYGNFDEMKNEKQKEFIANQFKDFFSSSEVGDFVNTISTAFKGGGVWGAVIAAILTIAQKAGILDEMDKDFEEGIDMIAKLFKPLRLVFDVFGNVLNRILKNFLEPLMPVFKVIGKTVAVIAFVVESILTVVNFIANTLIGRNDKGGIWGKIANIATGGLYGAIRGAISGDWTYAGSSLLTGGLMGFTEDSVNKLGSDLSDNFDELLSVLDSIDKGVYEIAESEYQDKLNAWQEMYNQGLISLTEFQNLWGSLSGLNYDRVRTNDLGSYYNGRSNTTIVYQDDVKITIDGTNLSADQIAVKVAEYWKRQERAGSSLAWGV